MDTAVVATAATAAAAAVMTSAVIIGQRTVIEDSLSREAGEVLEKWKWLADMHNHVLSQVPEYEKYQIDAGETRHTFSSFIDTC